MPNVTTLASHAVRPGRGPPRRRQSTRGADRRQQHPLDDQLPHDLCAAAAERLPHRDLPSSRRASRQQQVRQVQAGDGEHQHGHQCQQAGDHGQRAIVLRPRADAHPRQLAHRKGSIAIGAGILRAKAAGKCVQGRRRRGDCESGLERADQIEGVILAIREAGLPIAEHRVGDRLVGADRQIPLRRDERERSAEAASRDADHREVRSVDADRAADKRGIEMFALPGRVRRNRDSRAAARLLFARRERTAGGQPDAQRLEVVRRHDRRRTPGASTRRRGCRRL